ncbi:uncharacterized protein AMSG_01202 [Thecamonas trahens ATCC 50062]|uniref:ADP-ribosylhydrolase ARH3 n=1 Tax=Thecamonas trahens ATCC 50062 TaxID=461836 RepID=A0A0L0DPY2_THETB|nr:hypothetical protein AMSG_01202 [Thecamonas trahens ATCC 50062]KNC53488.1 hypothetical protein AMSG_01202 [Thecamonas trahens ATCC 50062]|eukprot:XP_013761810.1 hypothetical protein AMSG_01202 [Thecamonas trahens ATCC 50062]
MASSASGSRSAATPDGSCGSYSYYTSSYDEATPSAHQLPGPVAAAHAGAARGDLAPLAALLRLPPAHDMSHEEVTLWLTRVPRGGTGATRLLGKALARLPARALDARARGSGKTPAHLAVESNRPEAFRMLLEAGASAAVRDVDGRSPLAGVILAFAPRADIAARMAPPTPAAPRRHRKRVRVKGRVRVRKGTYKHLPREERVKRLRSSQISRTTRSKSRSVSASSQAHSTSSARRRKGAALPKPPAAPAPQPSPPPPDLSSISDSSSDSSSTHSDGSASPELTLPRTPIAITPPAPSPSRAALTSPSGRRSFVVSKRSPFKAPLSTETAAFAHLRTPEPSVASGSPPARSALALHITSDMAEFLQPAPHARGIGALLGFALGDAAGSPFAHLRSPGGVAPDGVDTALSLVSTARQSTTAVTEVMAGAAQAVLEAKLSQPPQVPQGLPFALASPELTASLVDVQAHHTAIAKWVMERRSAGDTPAGDTPADDASSLATVLSALVATDGSFGDVNTLVTVDTVFRKAPKTASAYIRVLPLALWGYDLPANLLGLAASAVVGITHPAPLCRDAGAVFAIVVAALVRTGKPAAALAAAINWARVHAHTKVRAWLREVADGEPLQDKDRRKFSSIKLPLVHGLRLVLDGASYADGLASTLLLGGDAAVNAPIVGALLGARWGGYALPSMPLDTLLQRSSQAQALLDLGHQLLAYAGLALVLYEQHVPRLEPIDKTRVSVHQGPNADCNWVVPGLLVTGATPPHSGGAALLALLRAGVTGFVALGSGATPAYAAGLHRLARDHADELELSDDGVAVHAVKMDADASDAQVVAALQALLNVLRTGAAVYIHCDDGHGLSGMVAAIALGLVYGLAADDALARIEVFHSTRAVEANALSPSTKAQARTVVRILKAIRRGAMPTSRGPPDSAPRPSPMVLRASAAVRTPGPPPATRKRLDFDASDASASAAAPAPSAARPVVTLSDEVSSRIAYYKAMAKAISAATAPALSPDHP